MVGTELETNLEKVRYFRAIVTAGSFQAAARELHVSQPALTRSIQALESILGVTLLIRSPLGVLPTAEGERLYRFAQALSTLILDYRAPSESTSLLEGRTLVVGAYDSIATYYLSGLISQMKLRFPKLRLELRLARSARLVELLVGGDVDLILGTSLCQRLPRGERFQVSHLFADHFTFFAAANFDPNDATLIFVPDIRDDQGTSLEEHVSHYMPFSAIRCENLETVKNLALERVGIGVLPGKVGASARTLQPFQFRSRKPLHFGGHHIQMAWPNEAPRQNPAIVFIREHALTWAGRRGPDERGE